MRKTLRKKRELLSPSRTVPLSQRWPQGATEMIKNSAVLGFEPWVPKHSRLFTHWNRENFALGPVSNDTEGTENYTYFGKNQKLALSELQSICEHYSLVVLDAGHTLASTLKSDESLAPPSLMIVNSADAFVDFLVSETWVEDWIALGEEDFYQHAEISPKARLEPGVLVGPGAVIGDDVVLCSGVRIGAGVVIGNSTKIGSHSVVCDGVRIGADAQIGPHCALGTPGFGIIFYPNSKSPRQRMHAGTVVVGDRVRLGAFVSVDRGVFGDTVLGAGTQVDNHVQIAHNCELGEDNVICGFVGLSGSTTVGSRTTFAGLVGTKGHVTIGSDVIIGAQSGVSGNIADGEQVKGYPPRPMAEALKIATLTTKLPELYERIKRLEKKVIT
jgi:UDP-3-O-[3-hydroxymyristoyl] glucosamine N-acyltransferase LpxD